MQIVVALLDIAAARGYVLVGEQELVCRDAQGLYVRLLPAGRPVITLRRHDDGMQVRLSPQRSFGSSGGVRSISFSQIPDVTVEVRPAAGPPRLYLFDPKYKLDSQHDDDALGEPMKVDIDKMHAYRDALRGPNDERVVHYAAILYPGPVRQYAAYGASAPDIAALPANPEHPEILAERLRGVLMEALK